MIIAVDFDGTIVEHKYPDIGKERPFAIDTLKRLSAEGHKLILWSVRKGKLLDEAVEFCHKRGVEFYAVNKNYPDEASTDTGYARKLKVDLFIDDRCLGGLPDWGTIYRMIHDEISYEELINDNSGYEYQDNSGFFARLLRRLRPHYTN
jgi:hypothetical protein